MSNEEHITQHPVRNIPGFSQLEGFLLGAKIRKVEAGLNDALILTLDSGRGRVRIQGQFNLHMEAGNAHTTVIDVEAKLS